MKTFRIDFRFTDEDWKRVSTHFSEKSVRHILKTRGWQHLYFLLRDQEILAQAKMFESRVQKAVIKTKKNLRKTVKGLL